MIKTVLMKKREAMRQIQARLLIPTLFIGIFAGFPMGSESRIGAG
jgi:hypothetical protein